MMDSACTALQRSQVHYITLAADLAGAMIRELKYLEAINSLPAFSITTCGAPTQERLRSLLKVVERLSLIHDVGQAADLIAQAKTALLGLTGELELLARAAERDFKLSTLPQ